MRKHRTDVAGVGLPAGTKIGKYEIIERYAMGGQAIVYKAYDSLLDRNVAIKQISSHLAEDPQFMERFSIYPASEHGADMLPLPIKFVGEELPAPALAPTVGEHNEQVLRDVLGYADAEIAKLKDAGALG